MQHYVEKMLSLGSMRREWCFLVESDGQELGRFAFWCLPDAIVPSDIVLVDADWTRADIDQLGRDLIRLAKDTAASLGAIRFGHVLDSPAQAPQWQWNTEGRKRLFLSAGLSLQRETQRYELAHVQQTEWTDAVHLKFVSLQQVGARQLQELVRLSAMGPLDRTIDPNTIFDQALAMRFESEWWEAAYTTEDQFVGTVLPVQAPAYSTIGFVGVVPEVRGKRLGETLLRRGSWSLLHKASGPFRSDVDMLNAPMRSAFGKSGWRPFARRWEFEARLETQQ